jgi:PBP1b-binding outer membrane lipoprotein LpoB
VLITTAIALGVCTVTLWTPYPVVVPSAATPPTAPPVTPLTDTSKITDEMIASMLDDPFPARRQPRVKLVPLIPVVHGFGALTTFMLAVLAAISTRLGTFTCQ